MTDVDLESALPVFGTVPDAIIDAIAERGWYVGEEVLPASLMLALREDAQARRAAFDAAGTGRGLNHDIRRRLRTDAIQWLDGSSEAQRAWLEGCEALRLAFNRHLFMGLFNFECHYARYDSGDFYGKHVDAFRGERNRVLTVVTYLNPDWQPENAGELVIYRPDSDEELTRVLPRLGTLVVFLSEDYPHEVLPARQERLSIAGWYRINTSSSDRVDPAR
ncbi:2OG-Fe(II) oxygenase [Hahella sp. SMD15-11]|uniref:2OG-Fe(II) oxygenase n=1 Tax=Thermohahella caldifontis TaxID=3142973 RepID=A0AB39UWA3_9GAMM